MLNSLIQIDGRIKKTLKILICANYPRNLALWKSWPQKNTHQQKIQLLKLEMVKKQKQKPKKPHKNG